MVKLQGFFVDVIWHPRELNPRLANMSLMLWAQMRVGCLNLT